MAAVISAIADYMLAHGRRHVAAAFSSDSNDWPRLPPERSAHRPRFKSGPSTRSPRSAQIRFCAVLQNIHFEKVSDSGPAPVWQSRFISKWGGKLRDGIRAKRSTFTAPIINAPQVAILSTDAIKMKPALISTPQGDFVAAR